MSIRVEIMKERLRSLRKEKNWTQGRLAKEIHSSKTTVSDWETENKTKIPDTVSLIALSELYGVSINYILGMSDYRNPENEDKGLSLGLSEKSVEVLKYLKSYKFQEEGVILANSPEENNKQTLDFINMALESISESIQTEFVNEVGLTTIFTYFWEYITSRDTTVSVSGSENITHLFFDRENKISAGYTVDEVYREIKLKEIRMVLDQYREYYNKTRKKRR